MERKYIFFDIDGTLTDKTTGEIIPSAKRAIQRLIANHHFVCIATGRAYYKTKEFAKMAGISHIVSNGGAALTIDGQLIENKPLNRDLAVKLCQQAQELGFGVLVAENDNIDVTMIDDRFIKQVGFRKEPTRYFYDQSLKYTDIVNYYKIYIAISKEDEHLLTLRDTIGHIRFMNDYLTYQHDQKDQGIKKIIEKIGGNLKDVVVFGDDYNDLVMFKDEWTCIAMGNACDELKQKATFVTKSNIEDGIEYACEYFGWI